MLHLHFKLLEFEIKNRTESAYFDPNNNMRAGCNAASINGPGRT